MPNIVYINGREAQVITIQGDTVYVRFEDGLEDSFTLSEIEL